VGTCSATAKALLMFFVIELLLRMGHYGCENFLRQYGNLFDLVIVLSGVFDMWSSRPPKTLSDFSRLR